MFFKLRRETDLQRVTWHTFQMMHFNLMSLKLSDFLFLTWPFVSCPPACRWRAAPPAPCRTLRGRLRAAHGRDSHTDVQQPPVQVLPSAAAGVGALVPAPLHPHPHRHQQRKGQQAQWVTFKSTKTRQVCQTLDRRLMFFFLCQATSTTSRRRIAWGPTCWRCWSSFLRTPPPRSLWSLRGRCSSGLNILQIPTMASMLGECGQLLLMSVEMFQVLMWDVWFGCFVSIPSSFSLFSKF